MTAELDDKSRRIGRTVLTADRDAAFVDATTYVYKRIMLREKQAEKV